MMVYFHPCSLQEELPLLIEYLRFIPISLYSSSCTYTFVIFQKGLQTPYPRPNN